MIKFDERANKAVEMLQQSGFEAFFVGGCVRDGLMGKELHDFDITTNALPKQICDVFKGFETIEVGIEFGTVVVIVDGLSIEITTYRKESEYLDNRHPSMLTFSASLDADLSRRDFTINALAYNTQCGIVDHFGGLDDIKNKKIRCIGNPDERFKEDALRILRALRFASVLGFEIDDEIKNAMQKNKELLKNISGERIFEELCKMIVGKNIKDVLINYVDVLAVVIPELLLMKNFDQKNIWHIYDVLTHTAVAVSSAKEDCIIRIALLFHDIGKPKSFFIDEKGVGHFYGHPKISKQIAEKNLTKLKVSNKIKNHILLLVENHDITMNVDEISIKKLLSKFGEQVFDELVKIHKCDLLAQNPKFHYLLKNYDQIEKLKKLIIAENQCYLSKDLKISGTDIKKLGLNGKEVGKALELCLRNVIENELKNEKEDLILYVKNNIKNIQNFCREKNGKL